MIKGGGEVAHIWNSTSKQEEAPFGITTRSDFVYRCTRTRCQSSGCLSMRGRACSRQPMSCPGRPAVQDLWFPSPGQIHMRACLGWVMPFQDTTPLQPPGSDASHNACLSCSRPSGNNVLDLLADYIHKSSLLLFLGKALQGQHIV